MIFNFIIMDNMYIPIVAFFASDITESNVNFNPGFLAETNTNDFDNFLRFPRRDELSLVQPAYKSKYKHSKYCIYICITGF